MHYSRSCCDIKKNRALYRYRFECVVYRIVEIECASSEICTCGVSKIDLKRRCCMRHMRSVTPRACPIPLTTLPKHPAGRWPSPGDARRTARHVVPSPPPPAGRIVGCIWFPFERSTSDDFHVAVAVGRELAPANCQDCATLWWHRKQEMLGCPI